MQTASVGHERERRMGKSGRGATVYRRLVGEKNEAAGERAPKGYVPVLVGSEKKMQRVLIHTKQFRHPYFAVLLEMAADEFGYEQQGILRIPCDVEYFRQVVDTLSKAKP
ncbi:auxin-responsive protein SAUR71-like [Aristolochia californica]|uniref:auxin-responsive protein SAUR71-like n=1 Tax=Aristolochia californica TaxID=171875 RepID=UPI0035DD9A8D